MRNGPTCDAAARGTRTPRSWREHRGGGCGRRGRPSPVRCRAQRSGSRSAGFDDRQEAVDALLLHGGRRETGVAEPFGPLRRDARVQAVLGGPSSDRRMSAVGVDLAAWSLLALAAGVVGFSKTAVSGASMISIVLFASVLPVRESTGALLLVLLVGDLLAIWTYRRDAHWYLLRRLVGPVLVGLGLGAVFLAVASAALLRPVIGAIVVVMVAIQVWRSWRGRAGARRRDAVDARPAGAAVATPPAEGPAAPPDRGGPVFGALAGFTTMVANAAGPVMTLYLLRSRLDVVGFVGTMAWFFFAVNLAKLPISLALGLVQPSRFLLVLTLVPAVFVGAMAGRALILRVPKVVFEWTVLVVAGLSGLYLLFA